MYLMNELDYNGVVFLAEAEEAELLELERQLMDVDYEPDTQVIVDAIIARETFNKH